MISLPSLNQFAYDLGRAIGTGILAAAGWCKFCWRKRQPEYRAAVERHPSAMTPRTPAPIEPHPFTDAELEEGYLTHLMAQARSAAVDQLGYCWVGKSLIDLHTCEAIGALPAYGKEESR